MIIKVDTTTKEVLEYEGTLGDLIDYLIKVETYKDYLAYKDYKIKIQTGFIIPSPIYPTYPTTSGTYVKTDTTAPDKEKYPF